MPSIYWQVSLEQVIITICAILVIVAILGGFVSFVTAVYFFLFSKGKEEKKTKGRNAIRYMIIGLVLMVLFLTILPLALKGAGVEVKEYSTKAIFTRVGEIIQKSFHIGTVIKDSQTGNQYRGDPYININDWATSSPGYQL